MAHRNFYAVAKNLYRRLSGALANSFALNKQGDLKVFSRRRHNRFRSKLKHLQKQRLKPIKENSIRELLELYQKSQHQLNFSVSDQILNRKHRDWRLKETFGLTSDPLLRPILLSHAYRLWDKNLNKSRIQRQGLYKKFDHKSLMTEVLTDVQLMSV